MNTHSYSVNQCQHGTNDNHEGYSKDHSGRDLCLADDGVNTLQFRKRYGSRKEYWNACDRRVSECFAPHI